MITTKKIIRIKRMRKDGASINQIARAVSVSWATVKKYLQQFDTSLDMRKMQRSKTTDKYADRIMELVKENETLGKQRLTVKRIYEILNPPFSLRTLQRFVKDSGFRLPKLAHIPLEHVAGSAQIDFGAAKYVLNNEEFDGRYLVLAFAHSGAIFAILLPSENQQCLMYALARIFEYIGGVPHTIRIDNASSMVDRKLNFSINEHFEEFAAAYGFEIERCNPARGNEKGTVERAVSTVRQNFLSPPPFIESRDSFNPLKEFNELLLKNCLKLQTGFRYGTKKLKKDLYKDDVAQLLPLPLHQFSVARREVRKTDKCAVLTFDKHQYSTRSDFACKSMIIEADAFDVNIYDNVGNFVAHHPRCYGSGNSIDFTSYIDSFVEYPRSLYGSGCTSKEFSEHIAALPKERRREAIFAELFKEYSVTDLEEYRHEKKRFSDLFKD